MYKVRRGDLTKYLYNNRIKVSKKEHDGENTLANAMVEKLNKDYGDPKFTGVSHPFRMAGFSNKKENKKKKV